MHELNRRNAMMRAAAAGVASLGTALAVGAEGKGEQSKQDKGDKKLRKTQEQKLAGITAIGIAQYMPVVYAGNAGGGADEFAASNDPGKPNDHVITAETLGIPANANILAAWYTATHNIASLPSFSMLRVQPFNKTGLQLSVGAPPGVNARLRLTLYALYFVG